MTDVGDQETLSPAKRALYELRTARARIDELERVFHEPIAIVGMGMRFPGGAVDAVTYAQLLTDGIDAITEIPPERWAVDALYSDDPDAAGKMTVRHGGFLTDVDQFDAPFFGISPREAESMDPQQRLLLEVAWEALEDAGHASRALAGSRTGVYVGLGNGDYGRALLSRPELIDAYFTSGSAFSVAAGRLSYFLGLHGPSIAIDTACSSSLVALHLACQGLRLGECDLALAGGVNLILTPEIHINFSKARMMAPDGRCKTFDAAADGYVRGEGCGVVVLRRLRDALAGNDRILGLIRGSAVNQDGQSGGLTVPNGPAQEAVIRAALEMAQVEGRAIGYVEAHGTGTALGDPIEVGALGAVLCNGREATQPLAIGSVKTNIGHLEAAAGIAGMVKVVLGLQQKIIAPHLHFRTGNPHIAWDTLPIVVPSEPMAWPTVAGRRLAGVSSFGFSGTNAHVIIEEAPESVPPRVSAVDRPIHILALSARSDAALANIVKRYERRLVNVSAIADVCFTANTGRSHFAHRLAVVGASADELRAGLDAYVRGAAHPRVAVQASAEAPAPRVAFMFTGQGAQQMGMGRTLYETSPVFRAAMDECAARLGPHLDRNLLDVIYTRDGVSPINDTLYAQPATFAIEYALATLWRSWGIEPAVVLGHSLGEYAAACVAGVISLDDALRTVAARGRLTHALPGNGGMAAVFAPEAVVLEELARANGKLTIAAYNGPEHFVISGLRTDVTSALARLEATGVRVKMLRVPHAAHSPLVEPVLGPYAQALRSVRFSAPRVALVSNVTGELADADLLCHTEYWLTHMRAPVQFAKSLRVLGALGVTHCIEVGPHPVLLGMAAECVPDQAIEWLPSLRRDQSDWSEMTGSLQRVYVGGADVDWDAFDRPYVRRRVALPTYPFQRRRHWLDAAVGPQTSDARAADHWPRLTAAIERASNNGPVDLDLSNYPAKWGSLERLTNAYVASVLRGAGIFAAAGERATPADVRARLGAAASFAHLLSRWLRRLANAGLLRADADAYVADRPLPDPDLAARWADAEAMLPDNAPLLAYIQHCGALLPDVLAGRVSPIETLFPGGAFDLAEGLYEHSATLRYVNGVAAVALEAVIAARGESSEIRILEVGAGTGSSTASLLPLCPPDRTTYWYTDVSPAFFDHARARFSVLPFVRFAEFDLERDPAVQGFVTSGFDVIFASNTVHATRDVPRSLARLRDMLAPGGVLVLVESTAHLAWLDVTIGVFEGWQHFADDLRAGSPLLAPEMWVQALDAAGFERTAAYPSAGTAASQLGQHVLIARREAGIRDGIAGEFVAARMSTPSIARPEQSDILERMASALAGEREELLREFVAAEVLSVLKLDASARPSAQHRLMDLGFDSLMAVQLRNRITTALALGRRLPATLLFDYPSIAAIARHLLSLLFPALETRVPALSIALPSAGPLSGTLDADAVAAMTDAEIEKLLLERMGGRAPDGRTR